MRFSGECEGASLILVHERSIALVCLPWPALFFAFGPFDLRLNLPLGPAQHRRRDADGAAISALRDGANSAGVACHDSVRRKFLCLPHVFGNLQAVTCQQRQKFLQVVNIRERLLAANENRLDGLLRGLLSVEALVFKITSGYEHPGSGEVAARSVEPFAWVVRRKPLGSHK